MKKFIAVILILAMMLSLTGCMKSKAVREVEMKIDALEDLPMEYMTEIDEARELIDQAFEAYNELSQREQKQVSNYADLEEAREDVFEAEYGFMVSLIKFINLNTDVVAAGTVTVWDNVGASDFFTYYNAIGYFEDEDMSLSDYNAKYGTNVEALLWGAGRGLCPEYVDGGKILNESAIIKECANFNLCYDNIETGTVELQERVSRMMKDYGDDYDDEMDLLHDWWVESGLYADLAMNPEGSLASYTSAISDFQDNIDRYAKNADMQ